MRIYALEIDEYVKVVENLMPNTDTEQIYNIAKFVKSRIEGAEFPIYALRDDLANVQLPQGLNPIIAGLMLGIMYERTVIVKQLREQGVVIVRLDH